MNVLVYVSDALRIDHLGCYGARFLNTRTIDELAAGGVRFEQAISAAPWTAPSMTSMVTGLYPHHHGTCTGTRSSTRRPRRSSAPSARMAMR